MTIHFYQGDLPSHVKIKNSVAIDTETMGLDYNRDRLCLIQLSTGDGDAHLVQLKADIEPKNLKKLCEDRSTLKLFHFGRFDIAMMYRSMGVLCAPVYCTKIASKLCRTYTDRHGLKDLCRELLGVELSKQQQSSDWGADELSDQQKEYAANDVLYLHQLKQKLDEMLEREQRFELAMKCYEFLPYRSLLDLEGWPHHDIFSHEGK